jgi:hypothetical protein
MYRQHLRQTARQNFLRKRYHPYRISRPQNQPMESAPPTNSSTDATCSTSVDPPACSTMQTVPTIHRHRPTCSATCTPPVEALSHRSGSKPLTMATSPLGQVSQPNSSEKNSRSPSLPSKGTSTASAKIFDPLNLEPSKQMPTKTPTTWTTYLLHFRLSAMVPIQNRYLTPGVSPSPHRYALRISMGSSL